MVTMMRKSPNDDRHTSFGPLVFFFFSFSLCFLFILTDILLCILPNTQQGGCPMVITTRKSPNNSHLASFVPQVRGFFILTSVLLFIHVTIYGIHNRTVVTTRKSPNGFETPWAFSNPQPLPVKTHGQGCVLPVVFPINVGQHCCSFLFYSLYSTAQPLLKQSRANTNNQWPREPTLSYSDLVCLHFLLIYVMDKLLILFFIFCSFYFLLVVTFFICKTGKDESIIFSYIQYVD